MAKKKLQHYGDERLGLIPGQDAPTSILDMLNVGKTAPKRERAWESKNEATGYRIPPPLIETAKGLQEKLLSCSQFDEEGNPRTTSISADTLAETLLQWAIKQVKANPRLIPAYPTPHAKTGITAHIAEWDTWSKAPTFPKPTRRKKGKSPRFIVAYRISGETKTAIREIADRTGVSLGEVFLRLLQIVLNAYANMKFRIVPDAEVIYRSAKIEEI
jgi:hypothetical protein